MLILKTSLAGSLIVVAPIGEVDARSNELFGRVLEQALTTERVMRVEVDCHDLSYLSSAGLGVIINVIKTAERRKIVLVFCALQDQIRKVLDMIDLSRLMMLAPATSEASFTLGRFLVLSQLENGAPVRRFINGELAKTPLSSTVIYALVNAVDELFVNLVKHAYRGSTQQYITLEAECYPSHVELRLLDKAAPFDPRQYQAHSIARLAEVQRAGGLGLRLVMAAADQVDYQSKNGVNTCTLTKRF